MIAYRDTTPIEAETAGQIYVQTRPGYDSITIGVAYRGGLAERDLSLLATPEEARRVYATLGRALVAVALPDWMATPREDTDRGWTVGPPAVPVPRVPGTIMDAQEPESGTVATCETCRGRGTVRL